MAIEQAIAQSPRNLRIWRANSDTFYLPWRISFVRRRGLAMTYQKPSTKTFHLHRTHRRATCDGLSTFIPLKIFLYSDLLEKKNLRWYLELDLIWSARPPDWWWFTLFAVVWCSPFQSETEYFLPCNGRHTQHLTLLLHYHHHHQLHCTTGPTQNV